VNHSLIAYQFNLPAADVAPNSEIAPPGSLAMSAAPDKFRSVAM